MAGKTEGAKGAGMGLMPKLIIGIFTPILLAFMFLGCMLFLDLQIGKFEFNSVKGIWKKSLDELGEASLAQSTESVDRLGEKLIKQKAEDVAKQLEIYLRHVHRKGPGQSSLGGGDPVLQEVVSQKVGETGYIVVFDAENIIRYHPDPKFVNVDMKTMYGKLTHAFVEINETALSGKDAGGYYRWPDATGQMRQSYMWISHVKDTNLMVIATTWMDEFSRPAEAIASSLNQLQEVYSKQYNRRFGAFILILCLVLGILLAVIYFYSYSVVRPIRQLSEAADKISMGELNAVIDVKAGGEIAVLAESIQRMQMSVKAAIERLQKRRSAGEGR